MKTAVAFLALAAALAAPLQAQPVEDLVDEIAPIADAVARQMGYESEEDFLAKTIDTANTPENGARFDEFYQEVAAAVQRNEEALRAGITRAVLASLDFPPTLGSSFPAGVSAKDAGGKIVVAGAGQASGQPSVSRVYVTAAQLERLQSGEQITVVPTTVPAGDFPVFSKSQVVGCVTVDGSRMFGTYTTDFVPTDAESGRTQPFTITIGVPAIRLPLALGDLGGSVSACTPDGAFCTGSTLLPNTDPSVVNDDVGVTVWEPHGIFHGNSRRSLALPAATDTYVQRKLGTLPGTKRSYSRAISADGSTLAGFAVDVAPPRTTRAWRWTEAGGFADLGALPGQSYAQALAISGDGAVVVGTSGPAFKWTQAGGMVALPTLSPTLPYGVAQCISADGAFIGGASYDASFTNGVAQIWTSQGTSLPMRGLFAFAGTPLAGYVPNLVKAIVKNSDGSYTFVGDGTVNGVSKGFILVLSAAELPVIATPPQSRTVDAGGNAVFTFAATGATGLQWQRNGLALAGATNASLTIGDVQPDDTGLYFATASNADGPTASEPAILGVSTTSKVIGDGGVVGSDIRHPNGNFYDQVLLQGVAASLTADSGQVTRMSFIDLNGDIVQVEFAGAGTLSLVLENQSGPAAPVNYHQPAVTYMKGHAGIVIVGANETTNVSVFSVGRATAFDPTGAYNILLAPGPGNVPANNGSSLFLGHGATLYDGRADLAFIAIASANGRFGGIRTANARYTAAAGYTGVYAPGVQFGGPVFIGEIAASGAATPVILLGSAATTQINGGNLLQPNLAPVRVSGLTQLRFVAGIDSHGRALPAQQNRAILRDPAGADVTTPIVVNPP